MLISVYWRWSNVIKFVVCLIWFTLVYRHVLVFYKTCSAIVDFCPLQKVSFVFSIQFFCGEIVDIITFPVMWILTCSRVRQVNDTFMRDHSLALAERLHIFCCSLWWIGYRLSMRKYFGIPSMDEIFLFSKVPTPAIGSPSLLLHGFWWHFL
jgi:hypothetical protein